MFRSSLLLMLFLCFCSCTFAQELNCKIDVNTQRLSVNDAKIMKTLEQTLNDFMNNTRWTNDNFKPFEKIECSILMTIDAKSGDNKFSATLNIQTSRPVYNSDYKTTMMNWKDRNFQFTYKEFDPIEFSENSFTSNMASTFAFYAYMIIGMDYDSYSQGGGTPYFNKAESVMQQVPFGEPGWNPDNKDVNDRTRGNMVMEMQNSRYKGYRDAMYTYHMKGLDVMYDDPNLGRSSIATAIGAVNQLNTDFSNTMIVQMFNLAKSNEIAQIFDGSTKGDKDNVMRVMQKLDTQNSQKYQQIMMKGK